MSLNRPLPSALRRLLPVLAVLLAALGAPAASAVAAPPLDRVALPAGFQPEGIEPAGGSGVFVGSLADGRIVRVDTRTGATTDFAAPVGAPTLGLARDRRRGLLWAAGGPSGQIRAYDLRTGALVRTYEVAGAGFLNDLTITRDAVYVTDSLVPQLAVIELGRGRRGALPAEATTVPLSGDIQYVAGPADNPAFNANGIVDQHGVLVIAQSETGLLFTVDPQTGVTRTLDTGGVDLRNADGLELKGSRLYVVRNDGVVERFRLDARRGVARPTGTLSGDLDYPSTGAFVRGALYVVNARFATQPTPTTPYVLTRLEG